MRSLKLRRITPVVLGAFVLVIGFQNCSPTKFEANSSSLTEGPKGACLQSDGSCVQPEPEDIEVAQPGDPIPDPEQHRCGSKISSSTEIVFDTPQPQAPATASFTNFATSNIAVSAERIDAVSNFAASNVKATAASIGAVQNFAARLVVLNAKAVGKVQSFAASEINIASHEVESISNFAASVCVSAQKIGSIGNLAGKVTLYGRNENGQRAVLVEPLRHMAAYVAVYDFEIPAVENQAIRAKFVNSHIGKLSATAGSITLVNTDIDDVSNFAGTIRLRGTSKVGSIDRSSARIIQE